MRPLIFAIGLLLHCTVSAQVVPVQVKYAQVDKAQTEASQSANDVETQLEKPMHVGRTDMELRATLLTDRATAYVNEQILVTLNISAPVLAFNITGDELALKNVDLVTLSRQQSTTDIDDIPYQNNKTVFALFPREPGVLQIPTLFFNAILPVSARGKDDGKGNPTLTASTRALQLTIEPSPASASSWLPAQNVEITSSWSIDEANTEKFRAGEPVTRQVSVKVYGQHPGAVPTLVSVMQDDVRGYPDQPEIQTEVTVTGLNGTLTQAYSIVASRPGVVTLPPIEVNWWNINEQQWQTTTLPAEQRQFAASTLSETTTSTFQLQHLYYALAAMTTALLCLAACCIALWQRNRLLSSQLSPVRSLTRHTEGSTWSRLQRSLRNKDLAATRRALIQWARLRWPGHNIYRLDQIPLQDRKVLTELRVLDEYLYSRNPTQLPTLKSINKALRSARKKKNTEEKTRGHLSELYPHS